MGFNHSGTRLLMHAAKQGLDFSSVLTIGRQGLHLSKDALNANLREFGFVENAETVLNEGKGYAESFLKNIGAKNVQSLDASDYESADIIQDMNQPIPDNLKNKFSTVIDGGSLEHVFNFPVAIKNCMEMIQPGGYYIGITPCNNLFGHGFYQFSPELYFRVFSKENGFEMLDVIFYQDRKHSSWYSVKDPNEVKSRVILSNSYPSYLFIMAKRVEVKNIFSTTPQQSDYQNISWKDKGNTSQIVNNQKKGSVSKKIAAIRSRISMMFIETGDAFPNFFKKIK